MKKILDRIPKTIDDIFAQFGASAHQSANQLRWYFAAMFLVATLWTLGDDSPAKLIYLALALLWLIAAVVFGRRAKTKRPIVSQLPLWMDVAILSFGLLFCAWQGVFNTKGWIILLCYFPVLALTARRSDFLWVVQVAAFLVAFYALVSLYAINSLALPRLLTIGAMALAAIALTKKPRQELTVAAQNAVQEAYQLGASEKEAELTAFVHAQSFPPARYNLPGLYAAYKHGVGTKTSGDFYAAFETARGPMVVLGDLEGQGLNAALEATELQQQITKVAHEKATLTEIATELNLMMCRKQQMVSCVMARWEGANLQYLNAGHLPVIHISKREPEQLRVNSLLLGANESPLIAEETIAFPKGDMLLLYTDGAYAGLAKGHARGAEEILRLVKQFSNGEVNTLCHRVFDCGLPEYTKPTDDSTVVIVRRQEFE